MTALRRFRDRLGRALEHPAVLPGLGIAGAVFVAVMVSYALAGDKLIGYDAHAYYQAAALDDPYRAIHSQAASTPWRAVQVQLPPPLPRSCRHVGPGSCGPVPGA